MYTGGAIYVNMATNLVHVEFQCHPGTGAITPQYHVVFDDEFTTIGTNGDSMPDLNSDLWAKLFGDSSFQFVFDDESEPHIADLPDKEDPYASALYDHRRSTTLAALDTVTPVTPLPVPPPPPPCDSSPPPHPLRPRMIPLRSCPLRPLPRRLRGKYHHNPYHHNPNRCHVPRTPSHHRKTLPPSLLLLYPRHPWSSLLLPLTSALQREPGEDSSPIPPLSPAPPASAFQREPQTAPPRRSQRAPKSVTQLTLDPNKKSNVHAATLGLHYAKAMEQEQFNLNCLHVLKAATSDPDTLTYDAILQDLELEEWKRATANEIASLEKEGTWEEVPIDQTQGTILPGTWVVRRKCAPMGHVIKHKA